MRDFPIGKCFENVLYYEFGSQEQCFLMRNGSVALLLHWFESQKDLFKRSDLSVNNWG